MTLLDSFPYLVSTIVPIGIALGTFFFAVRWGYSKQAGAIQEKTIDALQKRVDTLEAQAELDTKEITRLRQESRATRFALKRRGLFIEIKDDFITLIDVQTKRSQTVSMDRALRHEEVTTTNGEEGDEGQDPAI